MRPQIDSAPWSTAVSIASTHGEPGSHPLPAIDAHRIRVHLSPATRSFCRETGYPALREVGDIDLIPSGTAGGFDAETAYESLEIRLSPTVLDRVAAEIGRPASAGAFEMRHMLRNDRIFLLARALENDLTASSPSGILYAESVGVALAIQLLGLTEDPPARAIRLSPNQLKRVLSYIDAHLDQPLTLETLSREAGVSSSHLRTWFKVATGLTVHRYVLRRRVERARVLLLQGALRPSEVALEVGFAHQSHLARWIRREFGCTPNSLRRTRPSR
ncbi:AraC family transcriptional regulator [Bradyrhizobium prioriisuperbiae]|uniref:helix-turn-helix transcriptional regulator n=1 Tax=Bradyrhizobium prioriisuperbiae TaxID=2854389 RepID=UPI0028ED4374|nr:AraC family transcriptional regulator [Bradyrhizobium prioritasuperba]